MICSSVNLTRFICPSFEGPDSNSAWRKNAGAGQTHHETSPTRRNDFVFAHNPLGRAPVLLLADGNALFDSSVICAYLSEFAGKPLAGPGRWPALRLEALAQGLCEAGIALRWETVRRPAALRFAELAAGQALKLTESYDYLERLFDPGAPVDIGQIALATALDWLSFRNLPDFRPGRPRLTRWMADFVGRPSMLATRYDGETQD